MPKSQFKERISVKWCCAMKFQDAQPSLQALFRALGSPLSAAVASANVIAPKFAGAGDGVVVVNDGGQIVVVPSTLAALALGETSTL
jgi:hypothetical protein